MNQIKTKHIYTVTPPKNRISVVEPQKLFEKRPEKVF